MSRIQHLAAKVALASTTALLLAQAPQLVVAAEVYGPGDANANLSQNTSVSAPTVFTATGGDNNDTATANTSAEFSVLAGPLQLVAVPDLNFGQVDGNVVVNGGEKTLADNNVTENPGSSKNKTAFDGNTNGDVIVRDARGSGAGWQLNLSMKSLFTANDDNNSTLDGITLDVTDPQGKNSFETDVAYPLAGNGVGDTAAPIAKAENGHGLADTTYKLNGAANAKLHFPAGKNVTYTTTKPYQTDLTWTLVAAP